MNHQISQVRSFDNTRLFVQTWFPEKDCKASICLVHGIGEHSSRYHEWAEQFAEQGFAIVSYDQRGHGLSEGKRGVISSYDDFMQDIDVMLDYTNNLFPNATSFLYGHSMGGGEVLHHLTNRKTNYLGVISTSPWIISQEAPPKFLLPIIRAFNKVIPSFSITTSFNAKLLSHDKQVWKKYEEDELIHHRISFRLFIDAYDAGCALLKNTKSLQKPLLLLHGNADEITDCHASKLFADSVGNNCTHIQYDKAYHELHHEFCKQQVFQDILSWINAQLEQNH
ncbi:lysophospholipase [Labilibaculum sp.]|uniref:alpha/beta hydrolase n=1 Tax=Labilibaculum sp. TaxID=2060723 RepID=UPI0035619FF0